MTSETQAATGLNTIDLSNKVGKHDLTNSALGMAVDVTFAA